MRRRQQGVTLPVTLILLLAALLAGASAAHMALLGEKAARAERDFLIAFHAAEDALMDAERDIRHDLGVPLESSGSDTPPAWQVVDLAGSGGTEFGQLTGAAMETGQGTAPFRRPRYLVERLAYHPPDAPSGAPPSHYYRVTVLGFGSRPGSETVLQSTYLRDAAGKPQRHSWREVGDWQALHAQATASGGNDQGRPDGKRTAGATGSGNDAPRADGSEP